MDVNFQELYQAGEKKVGTDESKFNQILCSQSYAQLRMVFAEYKALSKKGLDQVIKSEMSGDLESGMLAICKSFILCVTNEGMNTSLEVVSCSLADIGSKITLLCSKVRQEVLVLV